MREIKFRGKRIDNGEWVHGVPVVTSISGAYMVSAKAKSKGGKGGIVVRDVVVQHEVDPATIGQYTGLKDKNGTEIYDGDILHRDGYWDLYVDFIDGAFCLVSCIEIQRINWSPIPIWNADRPGKEVVGNIYDNPELLGGAE